MPWIIRGCWRCGGDMYLDNDGKHHCILCGYSNRMAKWLKKGINKGNKVKVEYSIKQG